MASAVHGAHALSAQLGRLLDFVAPRRNPVQLFREICRAELELVALLAALRKAQAAENLPIEPQHWWERYFARHSLARDARLPPIPKSAYLLSLY